MATLTHGALQAGAESVFRYLERTAERVPEGVRWRTLDDEGRPQYRGDLYSNGGIPLFLADYYRLTGSGRALELGIAGATWCAAPDRVFLSDRFGTGWALLGGRTGVGLAWLSLARASGEATLLERASQVAAELLEREPGPVTGFGAGEAGVGVFLLRLWEQTRDPRHLAGATRRAEWLMEHAIWRDAGAGGMERGCFWRFRVGEPGEPGNRGEPAQPAGTSICHGVAGVAYFLLLLHQATGDAQWSDAARASAATLLREAREDRGGLNWLPFVGAAADLDLAWQKIPVGPELTRCQWCNGAPGIGLFFARAYEILGDETFLATAEGAAEATCAYGDGRGNPTYCHGLAGSTELLVELHRLTGARRWLDRALAFGHQLLAYRVTAPDGDRWPGDDPSTSVPDFMCGAAGTGHLFLRLTDAQRVRAALL